MNPMQATQINEQARAKYAAGVMPFIGGAPLGYQPPSYRDQLVARKTDHDTRSAELARALEILDKHPEIEELLSIVGRVI